MSWRTQSIPFLVKITLFFVCGFVVFLGLQRISFNVDVLSQLPQDLKDARGMSRLQKNFGSQQGLILSIKSSEEVISPEIGKNLAGFLQSKTGLTGGVSWQNSMEDPSALAELAAHTWLNAGKAKWTGLIERLSPGNSQENLDSSLEELAAGALGEEIFILGYDPLGLSELLLSSIGNSDSFGGTFSSQDGKFRLIKIQPPVPEFDTYQDLIIWVEKIRLATLEWKEKENHPALEFGFTGEPAFVAEISGSMEHDMSRSGMFTTILVGILFWVFFRRFRAMLILVLLLTAVLLLTVSIGALLFGALTIMGAGFVSIVIGLTIDYGAVLLEGGSSDEAEDPSSLRRKLAPPILWAAFTTAVVFLSLRLSSFPGIVQFGTLVTLGILIGAAMMILFFSPEAVRARVKSNTASFLHRPLQKKLAAILSVIFLVVSLVTFSVNGLPAFNPVFKPFQLKDSPAVDAFTEIQTALAGEEGWISYLMWHPTLSKDDSLTKLSSSTRKLLETKKEAGEIIDFHFPDALLPRTEAQKKALSDIDQLLSFQTRLEKEMSDAGFTDEPIEFLRLCFDFWKEAANAPKKQFPMLPQSTSARGLIDQIYSGKGNEICLLAQVQHHDAKSPDSLSLGDDKQGFGSASWEPLAISLQEEARKDLRRMIIPVLALLFFSLLIIFRNFRDLLLCLAAMVLGGVLLMAFLSISGIQVNAFAACAVPILIGTGLDYGIHMLFALRRSKGEVGKVVGIIKALRFCGLSSAVAFGSLAFSASEGLSNLGLVCGVGILLNMLVATCLLPGWWMLFQKKDNAIQTT